MADHVPLAEPIIRQRRAANWETPDSRGAPMHHGEAGAARSLVSLQQSCCLNSRDLHTRYFERGSRFSRRKWGRVNDLCAQRR